MHVRRIEMGDVWVAKALRLRALTENPEAFSSTLEREQAYPDEQWVERAELQVAGPVAATFLAFAHDQAAKPLGIVTGLQGDIVHPDAPTSQAELVSMFCTSTSRGKGIGMELVRAVQEWATASNYEALYLWVVTENESARHLYERAGFVSVAPEPTAIADPCANEVRMRWAVRT